MFDVFRSYVIPVLVAFCVFFGLLTAMWGVARLPCEHFLSLPAGLAPFRCTIPEDQHRALDAP